MKMFLLRSRLCAWALMACLGSSAAQGAYPAPESVVPPVAATVPTSMTYHGRVRQDDYSWLKDESFPVVDDPKVLAYLEAENGYYQQVTAPLAPLRQQLLTEVGQRQITAGGDTRPTVRVGQFWYYAEPIADSYLKRWHRADRADGSFTLVLDENLINAQFPDEGIERLSFSPDGRYAVWGALTEQGAVLRIYDLSKRQLLDDTLKASVPMAVWTADGQQLFYPTTGDNGLFEARLHRLGQPPASDKVVYQESKSSLNIELYPSQSGDYALIFRGNERSLQVLALSTRQPELAAVALTPLKVNVMHFVDHYNGRFFTRTNDQGVNYRVAVADDVNGKPGEWQTLLSGDANTRLTKMVPFADFVAVEATRDGLNQVAIVAAEQPVRWVAFPDNFYSSSLSYSQDPASQRVNIAYFSPLHPESQAVFDVASGQLTGLQSLAIDTSRYVLERTTITARDGVEVPVTLFYRKDLKRPQQPAVLTAYGAFGYTGDKWPGNFRFANERLSLLDRGVLYVMAHVRGGGELGPAWAQAGQWLQRKNSFNDCEDVAQGLIAKGLTQAGRITLVGDSAGGTLVAAVVNQNPALWAGAVLNAPWLDPLAEMLDLRNPQHEWLWREYGNPLASEGNYDYIASYNPYDQIKAQSYPPLYLTTRTSDTLVPYWQPAKWVARLRARKTDQQVVLLNTRYDGNHFGGVSPEKDRLERVEEMAFILRTLGLVDTPAAPL
ncbi:MAG: S9 family peptidase [Gammaproteobacteria bacterium]|nr:S9 family peptidase [Gammaproteobacteria bacterium]